MLGLRQRCVLNAVKQLAEAVLVDDQVLQRQFAIVELDLVQVLAAHRVIGAGAPRSPGVSGSISTQPMPSRPGLLSIRLKTTNMPASFARLISVLTPFRMTRSPLMSALVR